MEMQSYLEETHKIRSYDVDLKNQLKVSSIFNFMQDIASEHAKNLGAGWRELQNLGLFWALSWVKIEFYKYIKFEESFKIKTWPKGKHRLYALRDFLLFDSNNEIFCRAATAWLLVNVKSKRVNDLKNLPAEIPYLSDEHALKDLPGKISMENRKESLYKKNIVYTDLDMNFHVNNEKYVEFILNCFSQQFHTDNNIKSLQISFLSESVYGDTIDIYVNNIPGEPGSNFIEGVNPAINKPVFDAIIEWVPAGSHNM